MLRHPGSACLAQPVLPSHSLGREKGVTRRPGAGPTCWVCSGLGSGLTDLRHCRGCGSSGGRKKTSTADLRPSRTTSCPRSRAAVRLIPCTRPRRGERVQRRRGRIRVNLAPRSSGLQDSSSWEGSGPVWSPRRASGWPTWEPRSCLPWVFPTHSPCSIVRCAFTCTSHIFFKKNFFFYFYFFSYLAALGLSCGMQAVSLWHVGSSSLTRD